MTVTFKEIENIAKTLPVGYYIKRDIKVIVSETEKGSWYDSMNDTITVSYPMIAEVLSTSDEILDIEQATRCLFYHEVSHAFLTPKEVSMTRVRNIFEDERIESILRHYYMYVDFRTFLKQVTGFNNEKPKNIDDAFFQLVRFRVGPQEFLDRVHDLIMKWRNLSQEKPYSYYVYESDIDQLYYDFKSWFNEQEKKKETQPQEENGEEIPMRGNNEPTNDDIADDEETEQSEINMNIFNDKNDEQSEFDMETAQNLIQAAADKLVNRDLIESVQTILSRVAKATSRNSSAINAYSGVFDPRSVVRDDYKFFVQKNRNGHVKAYSKTHLTLVIDRSGSFSSSQKTVNQLIYALQMFEKSNPDFEFDIITCGVSEKLESRNDRQITCTGGNLLDNKIFGLFNSCQKAGYANYNIVLFDGDAFSDTWQARGPISSYYKNFGAFNFPNTTIISDYDNEKHIKKYCKNAKQIITSDYVDELIKNTMMALQMLSR